MESAIMHNMSYTTFSHHKMGHFIFDISAVTDLTQASPTQCIDSKESLILRKSN